MQKIKKLCSERKVILRIISIITICSDCFFSFLKTGPITKLIWKDDICSIYNVYCECSNRIVYFGQTFFCAFLLLMLIGLLISNRSYTFMDVIKDYLCTINYAFPFVFALGLIIVNLVIMFKLDEYYNLCFLLQIVGESIIYILWFALIPPIQSLFKSMFIDNCCNCYYVFFISVIFVITQSWRLLGLFEDDMLFDGGKEKIEILLSSLIEGIIFIEWFKTAFINDLLDYFLPKNSDNHDERYNIKQTMNKDFWMYIAFILNIIAGLMSMFKTDLKDQELCHNFNIFNKECKQRRIWFDQCFIGFVSFIIFWNNLLSKNYHKVLLNNKLLLPGFLLIILLFIHLMYVFFIEWKHFISFLANIFVLSVILYTPIYIKLLTNKVLKRLFILVYVIIWGYLYYRLICYDMNANENHQFRFILCVLHNIFGIELIHVALDVSLECESKEEIQRKYVPIPEEQL